jgi:hypothetical protein
MSDACALGQRARALRVSGLLHVCALRELFLRALRAVSQRVEHGHLTHAETMLAHARLLHLLQRTRCAVDPERGRARRIPTVDLHRDQAKSHRALSVPTVRLQS